MERDFLGMGVACSNMKASWEENARLRDVVFRPSSARKERSSSNLFPPQPSSATLAYYAPRKSYPEMQSERRSNTGRHGIQNPQLSAYQTWSNRSFSVHTHQNSNARAFPVVSSSGYSIPTTAGSSFFKCQGSVNGSRQPIAYATELQTTAGTRIPSTHGACSTTQVPASCKEVNKPKQDQMTIFYRGNVNVYDNIPINKAEEIKFLAANGSKKTFNNAFLKGKTPEAASDNIIRTKCLGINKEIHCIDPASPESVTSHSVMLPRIRQLNRCNNGIPRNFAGFSSNIAHASSALSSDDKNLTSKAIPLARKASLMRFLEKRKERIANMSPYIASQEPLHIGGMAADEAGVSRYSFKSGMTVACDSSMDWFLGMSNDNPCIIRPS